MGSSLLDAINAVRIDDLQKGSTNRDLQYDLDRRAERLEKRTGVRPMDWDEFKETQPINEQDNSWGNVLNWAIKGALIGALAMVASLMFTASAPVAEVLFSSHMLLALGGGSAAGFLGGAFLGVFDDPKPEMRAEQLKKYGDYLDHFAQEHARGRGPEQVQSQDVSDGKWQDRVRAEEQALPRERAVGV